MKLSQTLIALTATAALTACGSDDLSEEDAQQAFGVALSVTTLGSAQAGSVSTDGSSFTYTCPGGGSATFSGTFDETGTSGDFAWSITYDGCVSNGITIDGQINYDGTFTETSSQLEMTGELNFSGDIEGSCELDVNWSATTGASSASFEYEGSICGYDASIASSTTF